MKTAIIGLFALLVMWAGMKAWSSQELENNHSEVIFSVDRTDTLPDKVKNVPPQNTAFKKIRVHFKGEGQYYDRIEFWKRGVERPVKTVGLEVLHPFNGLPFKKTGRAYGSDQYDLTGVKKSELEKHIGKWEVPSTIEDQIPVAADGQLLAFDGLTMKEYTVVAYQLFLTNRLRQVIAIIADYFIFNSSGEITAQFRTNSAGLTPIVTQDGKYVAVKYGGEYGEDGDGYLPEGIKVYDAKKGGQVADYPLKRGVGNFFYFPIHDYIVAVDTKPSIEFGHIAKFHIVDIDNKKVYEKPFPIRRQPGLIIEADFGADYVQYYLDDKRKSPAKAFFEKDFKITELKN
ncbi:MAG: hypothetical protein H6557_33895 [Lewinellaceae bacterium]|nr:hypothetical protein [Lewinellaceae bacterium]